jgi:hypothetical protein
MKSKSNGGLARAASLTPERRKEISLLGVAAKKANALLPRATHGSVDHPMKIGDLVIPCYVLEDGIRVLSLKGFQTCIGMTYGGGRNGMRKIALLMLKLQSMGIDIRGLDQRADCPIRFVIPNQGTIADGYDARLLPDVCSVLIEAHQKGKLGPRLSKLGERAAFLQHGFATLGIIALVDEATGFQRNREKDALAKILEAFVAKELQPYVKKFPAEYYEELFRLRGLEFDASSVKRPLYFGHLTNDIIYRRLAPGVWKDIKTKVKRNTDGKSAFHLHRMLSPTIGEPALNHLINKVTTIMQLSETWQDFKIKLDRLAPAFEETMQLPLELEGDTGRGI